LPRDVRRLARVLPSNVLLACGHRRDAVHGIKASRSDTGEPVELAYRDLLAVRAEVQGEEERLSPCPQWTSAARQLTHAAAYLVQVWPVWGVGRG
jgi:hypothetical protein